MTTLQRLLKYPHAAVFDKSPESVVAFRLQHAAGCSWSIADGVMQVRAGTAVLSYSLFDRNLGQLAAALVADGFTLLSVRSELVARSALILVEGEGSQIASNGDNILAYTSVLWAILGSFAIELRLTGQQVAEALRQMVIAQASGEWLNLYGVLYNVAKLSGEDDVSYAQRIPREAFRVRTNAKAIELAILDETGFDVRIEEPWSSVFTLDESELSGGDAFYDGDTVGPHILQPVIHYEVDWPAVLDVIHRNRAAGVVVLEPKLVTYEPHNLEFKYSGATWRNVHDKWANLPYAWSDLAAVAEFVHS